LYPEDEPGPVSIKKPVVVESYDEIVFPEPSEGFLARVQSHPAVNLPRLPAGFTLPPPSMYLSCLLPVVLFAFLWIDKLTSCFLTVPVEDTSKRKRGDTKDNPLAQWFMKFSEADKLLQLAAARQQVRKNFFLFLSIFSLIEEILSGRKNMRMQTGVHEPTFILLLMTQNNVCWW
jgi:YEATS domain-containing protein 4